MAVTWKLPVPTVAFPAPTWPVVGGGGSACFLEFCMNGVPRPGFSHSTRSFGELPLAVVCWWLAPCVTDGLLCVGAMRLAQPFLFLAIAAKASKTLRRRAFGWALTLALLGQRPGVERPLLRQVCAPRLMLPGHAPAAAAPVGQGPHAARHAGPRSRTVLGLALPTGISQGHGFHLIF